MNMNGIETSDCLKTFDFGDKEGTKQTKESDKLIHNNIINNPDKPMYDEGETFNESFKRTIPMVKKAIDTYPGNSVLVTHNSIFGLIRLWNELGRRQSWDKSDRIKYTEQDNKFPTGSVYEMKGKNGPIFIVRHGETEDNLDKLYRRAKANLTERGIQQAKDAGKQLRKMLGGKSISKLVSSPLPRAVHTAKIITHENGSLEKKGR